MSDITILVPFLNEEKNLELLYSEISKSIKKFNFIFEVLFVDDGSTDPVSYTHLTLPTICSV